MNSFTGISALRSGDAADEDNEDKTSTHFLLSKRICTQKQFFEKRDKLLSLLFTGSIDQYLVSIFPMV